MSAEREKKRASERLHSFSIREKIPEHRVV